MTPLQTYRNALAEHGIELTPAEFLEVRAEAFMLLRKRYMSYGIRCPTHDDVFAEWLLKRGVNPYPPKFFGETPVATVGG